MAWRRTGDKSWSESINDGIIYSGIILCMHPANKRRRYIVTSSLTAGNMHKTIPVYWRIYCYLGLNKLRLCPKTWCGHNLLTVQVRSVCFPAAMLYGLGLIAKIRGGDHKVKVDCTETRSPSKHVVGLEEADFCLIVCSHFQGLSVVVDVVWTKASLLVVSMSKAWW